MSDAVPRSRPEYSQHLLRFTAREPVSDEAIVALEDERIRQSDEIPKNLFLYSWHRLAVEDSADPDEVALSISQIGQYQRRVSNIAKRGDTTFELDKDFLHEVRSGGQDGPLVGVGFRVLFNAIDKNAILAPPLFGKVFAHNTPENEGRRRSADALLTQARSGGFLPVYYKMRQTAEHPEESVERLRSVLKLGVRVAGLAVVPLGPKSARERNIYQTPPMTRDFKKVDAFFMQQYGASYDDDGVVHFKDDDEGVDPPMRNAS